MLATRKCEDGFPTGVANKRAEANSVVHDGKLKKGSIVRLKSYQANSVKGKRLVVPVYQVYVTLLTLLEF
jgi:hypothetical protein